MSTCLSLLTPNPFLSPIPYQTRPLLNPIFHRTHFGNLPNQKPFLRGSPVLTRFGLGQVPFPDPDSAEGLIKEVFDRAEGLIYTIADVAVSGSSDTVTTAAKQNSDWLSGISNYMEAVLKVLKDGLSTLHVPYAYGFTIILLTVLVKAATFPLTKKQVESAMAMRSLQPQIKAIQQRYPGDQERIQLETARLYKLAGINPLAGCLPTLATIPVWIGLYRALSNVADEGLLTEGFFWIPSLAGPTTIAARQSGSGISWLFPFVDGHPPLGWSDTLAYLVLPVLLIVSQYISVQIMQSSQGNDPNLKSSQAITKFLPLMIGYFSLSVPSGLSLYWFTNNILSTAQQVWLQKFGGAKIRARQSTDNMIKQEQPQIPKSIFETTTTKKKTSGEKLTSEGLRPGERFKQIKELEARRRRQMEEEKRRAEEAAASAIIVANEEPKKEVSFTEREDRTVAELLDARSEAIKSVTTTSSSSNKVYHVVNGDFSSLESKEDQNTSIFGVETNEFSRNCEDGRDGQHHYENQDKEEAVAAIATADDKLSGEDQTSREE